MRGRQHECRVLGAAGTARRQALCADVMTPAMPAHTKTRSTPTVFALNSGEYVCELACSMPCVIGFLFVSCLRARCAANTIYHLPVLVHMCDRRARAPFVRRCRGARAHLLRFGDSDWQLFGAGRAAQAAAAAAAGTHQSRRRRRRVNFTCPSGLIIRSALHCARLGCLM